MSGKREIEPSAEILDAAIREIVAPTLERIAADTGRRISLDAAVWLAEKTIANLPQIEAGITGNPILPGKLRLR